ncbi:MAG: PspC domain-containing protein [Acidobacteriaceae bacterium]
MPASCKNCGASLNGESRFCSTCGSPVDSPQTQAPPQAQGYPPNYAQYPPPSRLIRPRAGRMFAGVCQGLANSYSWDVVWVRVIAVLLAVFGGGIGLVAYLVFWVVMPEEPLALPQPGVWPPQQS